MKKIFFILIVAIISIFSFSNCTKSDDILNNSDYRIYKVIVTYKNCGLVESNDNSTILMSDNSHITDLEVIEPDYIDIDKINYEKIYNGEFVDNDIKPTHLNEWQNTISFAISTKNDGGEPFIFCVNIPVSYSTTYNYSGTFQRVYTITKKVDREQINSNNDLDSYTDDSEYT